MEDFVEGAGEDHWQIRMSNSVLLPLLFAYTWVFD
jgi:hypothetical protein